MASFGTPKTSTVKVNVDITAAGNIAQSGDTAAGTKTISFNGFNFQKDHPDACTVFEKILGGIVGASYDTDTAVKVTTQKTAAGGGYGD